MFRTVPLSIIRSFHCAHSNGICHTGSEQDQDGTAVPSWSCSQAVSKPVWHIPLLCVQWKTPDDGQRNCLKHVQFYSKNKFEKLVHIVGFIIRIYHTALSPERQIAATCFGPTVGPSSGWSLSRWSVQLIGYYLLAHIFIITVILIVNWKHYQLYTPLTQRSPCRWPNNWAETCSWNFNLKESNKIQSCVWLYYI